MHKKYFTFSFFLFAIFAMPSFAFATLDLIDIRTTPETPAPNQSVTINVESYAVDLNSATITWYVDGVAAKEGVAEKSFVTRTKDFGTKVTVDLVIVTADGKRFDKKLILQPKEVDILWEANTYTPPFYKGKALPTYKSTVKVTAIPRFNTLSSAPEQYYYKWTVNHTQGAGEGLGKNSATVQVGWADGQTPVDVAVSNPATNEKGSALQYVPVVTPLVLFYEKAPLLGVRFNNVIKGSINTTHTDFTIRAVPYFFSIDNYVNGELLYAWTNNSASVSPGINPNMFSLQKTGKNAESTTIGLTVQNRKRVLQQSDTHVIVNFEAE